MTAAAFDVLDVVDPDRVPVGRSGARRSGSPPRRRRGCEHPGGRRSGRL